MIPIQAYHDGKTIEFRLDPRANTFRILRKRRWWFPQQITRFQTNGLADSQFQLYLSKPLLVVGVDFSTPTRHEVRARRIYDPEALVPWDDTHRIGSAQPDGNGGYYVIGGPDGRELAHIDLNTAVSQNWQILALATVAAVVHGQ